MKTLWTPWRMEHVLSSKPPSAECLFEVPGTDSFSREHLLLYRDRHAICLLNRFPYANAHLLVAPSAHVPCLTELTGEQRASLMELVSESTTIIRQLMQPDGFNIGLNLGAAAGAGIPAHVHFHIVPRWLDDHNFMTVLADVRTIPEHIQATYSTLLPLFQQLFTAKHH